MPLVRSSGRMSKAAVLANKKPKEQHNVTLRLAQVCWNSPIIKNKKIGILFKYVLKHIPTTFLNTPKNNEKPNKLQQKKSPYLSG